MPQCPKPTKGESKQGYLSRCVRQCMDGGMDEAAAFGACTLEAQRTGLSAEGDLVRLSGRVNLEDTPKEEENTNAPRRFAILAHTGQIMERWGWRFVYDLEGMEVGKASIPALLNHCESCIVGYTDKTEKNAAGLHLYGVFSGSTESAKEVLALAQEGFPWQASIGVRALAITELREGASMVVNGVTVQGPVDVITQSIVQEISFCPLGQDNNTAAIVMGATKENAMSDTSASGAAATAATPAAQAAENTQTLSAAAPASAPPSAAPAASGAPTAEQLTQQALAAERERTGSILALCAKHNLNNLAQDMIKQGLSLDQAREKILDALAAQPGGQPMGGVGSMEMGLAEGDKFRALAAEGIAMAHGLRVDKPQEGSRQFMGMGLLDMARIALNRAGVNTLGMSRQQLADRLFSPHMRLAASVSDFSAIFMNVANKTLLQGYTEAGRTFDPWTNKVNARDFRDMYGVSLSAAPDLELVGENEEYKTGSLSDKAERYHILKYGRILSLSWEMVVNDDLNAFVRIPSLLGAAAARLCSDVVYGILLSGTMSDGKTIIHADHNNLAKTAASINVDSMSAARRLMRSQRGLAGERLNLAPAFLLIPTALETTADVLLRSAAYPDTGRSSGVINPMQNKVTPIVEQRLDPEDDAAPQPWWLVANPNQTPTIDVAYLDGQETPDVIQHESFLTDAMQYKARICMGAGAVEYRGFVKNPGVKVTL